MQKLNVHFINRGYGTDEGYHDVELIEQKLCEVTYQPIAIIRSPFGLKDNTLKAQFDRRDGWYCDLD